MENGRGRVLHRSLYQCWPDLQWTTNWLASVSNVVDGNWLLSLLLGLLPQSCGGLWGAHISFLAQAIVQLWDDWECLCLESSSVLLLSTDRSSSPKQYACSTTDSIHSAHIIKMYCLYTAHTQCTIPKLLMLYTERFLQIYERVAKLCKAH